jgi:hypothetical protein
MIWDGEKRYLVLLKKSRYCRFYCKKKIRIKRKNIKCEDTNVMDERILLVKSISGLKECVNVEIL